MCDLRRLVVGGLLGVLVVLLGCGREGRAVPDAQMSGDQDAARRQGRSEVIEGRFIAMPVVMDGGDLLSRALTKGLEEDSVKIAPEWDGDEGDDGLGHVLSQKSLFDVRAQDVVVIRQSKSGTCLMLRPGDPIVVISGIKAASIPLTYHEEREILRYQVDVEQVGEVRHIEKCREGKGNDVKEINFRYSVTFEGALSGSVQGQETVQFEASREDQLKAGPGRD